MAFHDPDSFARRGEQLESIIIAYLVLSWFFIALRTYTRTFINPSFGWDDLAIIFATMIFTSYCACLLYIGSHGGGTHVTSVDQLGDLTKRAVACQTTYIATVMMLKISLSIFFARIIVERWQFIFIYITVAISCVSASATFFYCLFRCGPHLDEYVMRQLSNLCAPRVLDRFFAYQHAALAFSTDCAFALFPVPLLWNTNMSRKLKVSIGFILSLATLGCICSAIRFRYIEGLTQIDDFFWNATNISIWSTIEPGAGIIAGCMATLRPLVKSAWSTVQSLHSSSSTTTTKSRPVEIGMTSLNEGAGDRKRTDTVQFSKNSGSIGKFQNHDNIHARTSQSTGHGSMECILSKAEERHAFPQDTSLDLDRISTCASTIPVHVDGVGQFMVFPRGNPAK